MVDPAHLGHGHSEAAVHEQARLVPEGQQLAGVQRRAAQKIHRQIILRDGGLPAWAIRHIPFTHI